MVYASGRRNIHVVVIAVAAVLPDCCGASPTMTTGLEALLDAGIITGNMSNAAATITANRKNAMPSSGWELPVSMQATTGIVYATSFPALDAAIAEVSKYFSPITSVWTNPCETSYPS